jgi:hypothetical protein
MTAQAEWTEMLNRYLSTVHTGGTTEQRAWAWARASDALDKLIAHDLAVMRQRSRYQTEELGTAA